MHATLLDDVTENTRCVNASYFMQCVYLVVLLLVYAIRTAHINVYLVRVYRFVCECAQIYYAIRGGGGGLLELSVERYMLGGCLVE